MIIYLIFSPIFLILLILTLRIYQLKIKVENKISAIIKEESIKKDSEEIDESKDIVLGLKKISRKLTDIEQRSTAYKTAAETINIVIGLLEDHENKYEEKDIKTTPKKVNKTQEKEEKSNEDETEFPSF